jgi:hypothetical protein
VPVSAKAKTPEPKLSVPVKRSRTSNSSTRGRAFVREERRFVSLGWRTGEPRNSWRIHENRLFIGSSFQQVIIQIRILRRSKPTKMEHH